MSDCEDQTPDHVCDPCESIEKARIGAGAFYKNTFVDPTNPTEWQDAINNGDVIILPAIRGTFDGGSPVEAAGYGRQSTNLTGYNFTANFLDPNYKSNGDFYNNIKRSRLWKFAYLTETQVHLSEQIVSIVPTNPVTENTTDDVTWNVAVKWAGPDLPKPYDAPAGIFDECIAVQ